MSQFGEVETVFGKVGRADTGTDPAPYSMAETIVHLRPRAEWPRIAAPALVLELGAGAAQDVAAPRCGRTRRRGRPPSWSTALDEAVRLPGWTSAWTAPARARMDMMSTGVRTPVGHSHRVARSHAAGRAGHRGARAGGGAARNAQRDASNRWAARPGSTFGVDPAALARHGVDPARSCDATVRSADHRRADRRDRAMARPERASAAAGAAHAGAARRHARGPGRPAARGDGAAASGLGRVRSTGAARACSGARSTSGGRRALRTERGELCAYVYVDLSPGTDLQSYVERARARSERRRLLQASSGSSPASASNGPGSTSSRGRPDGGCTGSSRWSRFRCWGCSSSSSAA